MKNNDLAFQITQVFLSSECREFADIQERLSALLSGYYITPKNNSKNSSHMSNKVHQFIVVKRIDGLSEKTLQNYSLVLKGFTAFINKKLPHINIDDIRAYLTYLATQRGLKDSSIATHINILKSFYSWAHAEGIIKANPMVKIKSKHIDKKQSRTALSPAELERVRDACETYREKALIELYFSTGCRLSELAEASISDIDFQERKLIVVGKGQKKRTVYFNNRAKLMLQRYLENRRGDSDAIFCSTCFPYSRLAYRTIQILINKIGQRSDIKRRVHPHILHHTFATFAINSGMPISAIQHILGHSDIGTTQIYASMSQSTIRSEYERLNS